MIAKKPRTEVEAVTNINADITGGKQKLIEFIEFIFESQIVLRKHRIGR